MHSAVVYKVLLSNVSWLESTSWLVQSLVNLQFVSDPNLSVWSSRTKPVSALLQSSGATVGDDVSCTVGDRVVGRGAGVGDCVLGGPVLLYVFH